MDSLCMSCSDRKGCLQGWKVAAAPAGLLALLGTLTEDALHLVLETLASVVRADAGAAAAWAQATAGAVLRVWAVRPVEHACELHQGETMANN
jgi:hypothetical protein